MAGQKVDYDWREEYNSCMVQGNRTLNIILAAVGGLVLGFLLGYFGSCWGGLNSCLSFANTPGLVLIIIDSLVLIRTFKSARVVGFLFVLFSIVSYFTVSFFQVQMLFWVSDVFFGGR